MALLLHSLTVPDTYLEQRDARGEHVRRERAKPVHLGFGRTAASEESSTEPGAGATDRKLYISSAATEPHRGSGAEWISSSAYAVQNCLNTTRQYKFDLKGDRVILPVPSY
jgi:hypothetical protein